MGDLALPAAHHSNNHAQGKGDNVSHFASLIWMRVIRKGFAILDPNIQVNFTVGNQSRFRSLGRQEYSST